MQIYLLLNFLFISYYYVLDGYSSQREYISTQAALVDTVEDFWRMVYKERSTNIVMLTELHDGNQEQCVKYWPSELNEWHEWNMNERQMVANAELTSEIAIIKSYEGPAWEGSDGFVTKRTFHIFSSRSNSSQDVSFKLN